VQTLGGAAGANRKGQGSVSRIYYGPAFQLPKALAVVPPSGPTVAAQDPRVRPGDPPLVPWHFGTHDMVRTIFQDDPSSSPADYVTSPDGSVNATQPPANRWLLARHAVVLVDDGDHRASYLEGLAGGAIRTAERIDDAVVLGGRVDAVDWELNDIRLNVLDADNNGIDPWRTQRETIAAFLFYPRAERSAPGTHRVDQALTNHVLAGACGSFIIDWTYKRGVGVATNSEGTRFRGFWDPRALPYINQGQPWFGLNDAGDPGSDRGVRTYDEYFTGLNTLHQPRTILPLNIEPDLGGMMTPAAADLESTGPGVIVYEAIFGYNRDRPLDPFTGQPWSANPNSETVAYTPWPSALRITMVLHDAEGKLEAGRQVQFVINLPPGE
jgi:hypothetical protein